VKETLKDKEQKIKELIENFSLDNLSNFFISKNSDFVVYRKPRKIDIEDIKRKNNSDKDKNIFSEIYNIGWVKLKDNRELVVFAIKTNQEISERSSKKAQFELGKDLLNLNYSNLDLGLSYPDAGIFIFYDDNGNFRFSFIYKIYLGTKASFNHYRRYTYYIQKGKPYRTFLKAFLDVSFDSLENILKAFQTQPLTKEFYEEIQNWFAWALKEAKFPGGITEENLIRLITRLMFVWFLKEKKLIPEEIFDEKSLTNVVKDFGKADYYYNVILQNLFFATLNRYPYDRKFATHGNYLENRKEFGLKTLYRYKDKILISEDEFIKLFEKVPFINGGLFECLDEDKNYIDGFSRNDKNRAKLPDYLFFSPEREEDLTHFYEKKKNAKVRGLINILKDYNFTADESSPVDIDVSLDPELLGHIFENLLASYNPETKETARKNTGSYYTPKEIVDFMVDESLIEYFKTNTKIPKETLRNLLSYSDNEIPLKEEEKKELIYAIDKLKVIDPAVGSGAFPMGIVHKLVYILNKIDPDNKFWYEIQYNKALHEVENLLKLEDKEEREKLLKEINDVFDVSIKYPDYARKLYIMENSIYGVDIQPIAIQISKLRFFLSLLIDQKVDFSKENFGIKPLPHLETKFVAANTLIGIKKRQLSLQAVGVREIKEELKNLYKKHFFIKTRSEKTRIEYKAKVLKEKIEEILKNSGWPNEEIEKIISFNIFSQTSTTDWFDPEWMFGIDDGFDIVISNPPYVSTKGVKEKDKAQLKEFYGFADDLYTHFYFKGMELLKENGILAYISSKTFWTIQSKKNLRDLILKNQLIYLYDTGNPFESAVVDTSIVIVKKKEMNEDYSFIYLDGSNNLKNPAKSIGYINYYRKSPNQVFFPINDYNIKIFKKYGEIVNELLTKWWDKISTSKNIEKYKQELEKYRKSLKAGDITLLGLIIEGGQGLATGNNGKYIGVLDGTKWADKVRKERPEKLLLATEFCKKEGIKNKADAQAFLDKLTENEIRKLFDDLKEKYGRDIFGQGWIYRIVSPDEIADVEKLTDDEKMNGIIGTRTFVPYDKGDKEGNRWYAPTPYYIDWSRENVKFLKENSGKKGEGMPVVRNSQFYFREGFCWNNVLSDEKIKCRIKEKSVHSTEAMTFISLNEETLPNYYLICMMNSTFYGNYRMLFINVSHHLTTGNAKEFPVIIPTSEQLKVFENIFNRAIEIQKQKFAGKIDEANAEKQLNIIQQELDKIVEEMYLKD